jgi:serine/threonine-protein kinase HipA
MADRVDVAFVEVWAQRVGAVAWDADAGHARFEYEPAFVRGGLELAPLEMPLKVNTTYGFPRLSRETYQGLPGMLADALPDRFGNQLIDAWLARQGRAPGDFSPVERLCYTGRRGMGALEFQPALARVNDASVPVEIAQLVELANEVLGARARLRGRLDAGEEARGDALKDILRVGTSAGGARAKAVIAIHRETGEVRSGQTSGPEGFEPWLLKFDGVKGPDQLGDGTGYGRIELAYHLMAVAAGVDMMECRLLEENGRAHFMTRRFDRTEGGDKRHVQSLCAVAHYDFNRAGAYGYEQAFQVMRRLKLHPDDIAQSYRRMVLNVLARNQDDHTKNIAFVMDRDGRWSLSPAFDVIYSYNPDGRWTHSHQMSINGKRDAIELVDLLAAAEQAEVRHPRLVIEEVEAAVVDWAEHARAAGVPRERADAIGRTHRVLGVVKEA